MGGDGVWPPIGGVAMGPWSLKATGRLSSPKGWVTAVVAATGDPMGSAHGAPGCESSAKGTHGVPSRLSCPSPFWGRARAGVALKPAPTAKRPTLASANGWRLALTVMALISCITVLRFKLKAAPGVWVCVT